MTIPVGNINYNMDYSAGGTPPNPKDDMAHGSLGSYMGRRGAGLRRGEWLVSKTAVLGTVRK